MDSQGTIVSTLSSALGVSLSIACAIERVSDRNGGRYQQADHAMLGWLEAKRR